MPSPGLGLGCFSAVEDELKIPSFSFQGRCRCLERFLLLWAALDDLAYVNTHMAHVFKSIHTFEIGILQPSRGMRQMVGNFEHAMWANVTEGDKVHELTVC